MCRGVVSEMCGVCSECVYKLKYINVLLSLSYRHCVRPSPHHSAPPVLALSVPAAVPVHVVICRRPCPYPGACCPQANREIGECEKGHLRFLKRPRRV